MVRVVINCAFGGFQLTRKATEMIAARGNALAIEDLTLVQFYGFAFSDHERRTDPDLVAVIEEIGNIAGNGTSLKVIDIPDDVKWYIDEYDGAESIHEEHRVWRGDE